MDFCKCLTPYNPLVQPGYARTDPPRKKGSSQTVASILTRSWLMISGVPTEASSGVTKPIPIPRPSIGENTPLVTLPTTAPPEQIS